MQLGGGGGNLTEKRGVGAQKDEVNGGGEDLTKKKGGVGNGGGGGNLTQKTVLMAQEDVSNRKVDRPAKQEAYWISLLAK